MADIKGNRQNADDIEQNTDPSPEPTSPPTPAEEGAPPRPQGTPEGWAGPASVPEPPRPAGYAYGEGEGQNPYGPGPGKAPPHFPDYGTSGWSAGEYNRQKPKPGAPGWPYPKQDPYGGYNTGREGEGYYGTPYGAPQPMQDTYTWNFGDYECAQADQKPRRVRGVAVFGVAITALVLLTVLGLAIFGMYVLFGREAEPPPAVQSGDYPQLNLRDRPDSSRPRDFSGSELTDEEIVQRVRPSVVGIAVYSATRSLSPTGESSGIIMNSEGHIITSAHVVEKAAAITVVLHNGDSFEGTLVGIDRGTDLAVIKISAENLTYAEFGNSQQLMVGERALAVGNPGGLALAGTATVGCISAVDRPLRIDGVTSYYIETTAAINLGNTGGPLVNSYGQVVGISSAGIKAEGYEGIGFAIPINDVKPVVDQIIKSGRVIRAALGITGQEIGPATALRNNLPQGIYIWSIKEKTDIAAKDAREGDIITHIDSQAVPGFDVVNRLLISKKPGDRVLLTLYRPADTEGKPGSSFELSVVLSEDGERQS